MIAVVDHHVEGGIVIGATPSSRLTRSLVQRHACPARGKAHRSGKSSKPGADHVDRAAASDEGVPHDDPQQPRARQLVGGAEASSRARPGDRE